MHNFTVVENTVRERNYISKAATVVMLHDDGANPSHEWRYKH